MNKNKTVLGKESLSWNKLSQKYRRNISDASILKLADKLGVSAASLQALEIGFDDEGHSYTFPMKNAIGEIVGIRRRDYKNPHSKRCVKGSKLGLFVPDGVAAANVQMICEGESDTAAGLTLGFATIGRPGITSCVSEAVEFLSSKINACPCIVADNGQSDETGLNKLATSLLAAGIPFRLLYPPSPFKDLREWLNADLTTEKLATAIERQPVQYPEGYPSGFHQVPNALPRLGLIAKIGAKAAAVLGCLEGFGNNNGTCWPGRDRIAELIGCSVRTVDRGKNILEESGILVWKRGGPGESNIYHLDLGPCRGAEQPHRVFPALMAPLLTKHWSRKK